MVYVGAWHRRQVAASAAVALTLVRATVANAAITIFLTICLPPWDRTPRPRIGSLLRLRHGSAHLHHERVDRVSPVALHQRDVGVLVVVADDPAEQGVLRFRQLQRDLDHRADPCLPPPVCPSDATVREREEQSSDASLSLARGAGGAGRICDPRP